jgi:hypothetical protein
MPKVNEIFVSLKIDLAKGEHLNFSSLLTLDCSKVVVSAKVKPGISGLAQRKSQT